jgi:hypothetical protein
MVWVRKELNDIQIAERVTSALSLIGCSFIIISFSSSSAFRKPINRLIFYASFENILSTVATLISRRGVELDKIPYYASSRHFSSSSKHLSKEKFEL